jgi:hypothetical protein
MDGATGKSGRNLQESSGFYPPSTYRELVFHSSISAEWEVQSEKIAFISTIDRTR